MGALTGLKILDFSTLLPGPYATLMLGDLGADIIKISAPDKKDIVADYPPYIDETDLSANQAWLGRNKKNLFLNLKNEKSKEIIHKLIMEYDIVIEQFRPGVMDRLGLGYEDLKKINPKIIYCSLTGYGQTGPLKNNAGHDINYLARSGNMNYSGKKSTGPVLTNMQIADIGVGSLNSVIGILSAVYYRSQTGKGQYIDVAMSDGLISFNAMEGASFLVNGIEPRREETRLNGGCAYDFYETKDNRYLSVGALEPKFWENFCNCIGLPELIEKTVMPKDVSQMKEIIRKRILEKTLDEWLEIFKGKDVCVEPVLTMKEALLEDEHIKARELVVDVEVANSNGKTIKQMASPIKLSECPIKYNKTGYPLGYHSEEILKNLGYSKNDIDEMVEEGITNIYKK
ncbi:CaiB/BaiF CoA-transferase family protein [Fusobacterium sp.]|uniref:CaiB/BaiF CoA transferase family protein n=1 Tax=Fusobacterium sp. TaxID=68766 RepID=UPI002628D4B3|nr:CaiB/BaiF CoA-transferase family protein [Fusobacterium sp.]